MLWHYSGEVISWSSETKSLLLQMQNLNLRENCELSLQRQLCLVEALSDSKIEFKAINYVFPTLQENSNIYLTITSM